MIAARALPRTGVPPRHLGALLVGGGVLGALASRAPEVALVLAAAGALACATLVRPDLATVALVACVWCNVPALAVEAYGVPVLLAALFPFMLVVPLVHGRLRGRRLIVTPAFGLLAALAVVLVASTLAGAHQDAGVEQVKTFALEGLVLWLLVVNAVRTPDALRAVVWGLIAAGAFMALITVHQQLTGSFERPYGGFGQVDRAFLRGQSDTARLSGPLGDPNYYAQALLAVVPLALLSIRRERAASLRIAAGAAAALIAVAIAYTYSRGAAVGFVLVLVGMVALGHLRARHLAAIALGVVLVLAAVPAYRDRIATITSVGGATAQVGAETGADQSARGRSTEMLAAGLAFLDHPVLGVGPGGFPFAYQQYAAQVGGEVHESSRSGPMAGEVPRREAHNILLGVAADLGLAGLALFLAILYVSIRGLLGARRRWRDAARPDLASLADGLLLALAAYLVAGLFLTLAFERYLWLLVALAAACANVASRSSWRSSD